MDVQKPKRQVDLKSKLATASSHTFEHNQFSALNLKENEYQAIEVLFKDCDFNGDFELSSIEIGSGCHFENCTFSGKFKITDAKEKPHKINRLGSGTLSFKNCRFQERLRITGLTTSGIIYFYECNFLEGLLLHRLTVDGLAIYNCDINVIIEIMDSAITQNLSFGLSRVKGECMISSVRCRRIEFEENNNFSASLNISNCVIEEALSFSEGEFKGYVNIKINYSKLLAIQDSEFLKNVNINYPNDDNPEHTGINSFQIVGAKFTNGFNVLGSRNITRPNPQILACDITTTAGLQGNLLFNRLSIHHLTISGYNLGAKITLKDIEARIVSITDFINEGMLVLSRFYAWNEFIASDGYRTASSLKITNSNLGKAQFFQTRFNTFQQIHLSNIILTDISTFNVDWFSSQQLENDNKNIKEYYRLRKGDSPAGLRIKREVLIAWLKSTREIYRQLKFVSIKQGDLPLSHRFQANEMSIYKKIMRYQKPRTWNEYLIMWSGQSNNFGQKWTKPIVFLLLFSFLTYLPIALLTSEKLNTSKFATSWSEIELNLEVICEKIRLWLVLLNPAHRISDLESNDPKFWVYFWDFISRFFVTFFIFQIVSAFRKFNK